MSKIKRFQVKPEHGFSVIYEVTSEEGTQISKFYCVDKEAVKTLVSSLSAFYSGDDCKCWINGEEAVLEEDFGLL